MGYLGCTSVIFILAIGLGFAMIFLPDMLKGMDSNHDHGYYELQAIVSAFCLSPTIGKLLNARPDIETTGGEFEFEKDGDIENSDYVQSSIYAVLYAVYRNAGKMKSNYGIEYQFTFNTWGIAPSPYPEKDPQRHGKAAYAALVTQPAALAYKKELGDQSLEIVEIGCGTGAGANLITREVHPKSNYLAIDMQQAAINTCNRIHATDDNPRLTCLLVADGVGNNENKVPREDNSVDFVVISETHIADIEIGDTEKRIFDEIVRILKPGGLFLWGNALPTRAWLQAGEYLPTVGFELVDNTNHTKGAVTARDEDFDRVEMVNDHILNGYPVMNAPYFGPRCRTVVGQLIKNFYRHPGTALYLKMVTGYDSYMHQSWRLVK